MKKVIAYFDGSNFYHLCLENYGLKGFDFVALAKGILKDDEQLSIVKFFTAPVNKQEDEENYKEQQRFFARIKQNPLLKLVLGKLVTRKVEKILINCNYCGKRIAKDVNCPNCQRPIFLEDVKKTTEKGVDVNLAIALIIDAINDEYDTAYLFSSDADFVPAINYVRNQCGKKVIYCHFRKPLTSDLIKSCSSTRLLEKEFLEKHLVCNSLKTNLSEQ